MYLAKKTSYLPMIVALAFASSGCGGGDGLPRRAVSGTVTLDGQPLDKGLITFTPAGGGGDSTSAAAAVADGSFAVAKDVGLVPGKYRVAVSVMKEVRTKASKKKQVDNATGEEIDAFDTTATKESLPARYNAQSELTADVTDAGPNEFSFPLSSK
jgi:hypothetical protein